MIWIFWIWLLSVCLVAYYLGYRRCKKDNKLGRFLIKEDINEMVNK